MTGLPIDPLTPIEAMIVRGIQHVEELERHIEKFVYRGRRRHGPYRIDHVPDGDDWFIGKVRLLRDPQPYMGVIAGECIYQFSHALDNLMRAMVRLKDPTRSENGPHWPYVKDVGYWNEQRWRTLLTPDHYEIVHREQPFNRDRATAFDDWTVRDCVVWLKDLSAYDKHEAVHVGYTLPRRIGTAQDESIVGFEWLYDVIEPLQTGTVLYRVKFVDPHIHVTAMKIEPDVAFEVEPGVWISAGAFRKMGEAVMALVEEVAKTTPEMGNSRTWAI